jgi:predicted neutral ceramidase superfamily lipid hydrolase
MIWHVSWYKKGWVGGWILKNVGSTFSFSLSGLSSLHRSGIKSSGCCIPIYVYVFIYVYIHIYVHQYILAYSFIHHIKIFIPSDLSTYIDIRMHMRIYVRRYTITHNWIKIQGAIRPFRKNEIFIWNILKY